MSVDDRDAATLAALRARRGDREAAEAFVRATQAEVWRLCCYLGDRAHADDLTQETYARAFAALPRFAGRATARTWLLSIARRTCADHVRSAVRRRRVIAPSYDTVPERETPDHAGSVAVQHLIEAIPAERREVFVLTQILGLSYAEAADVVGCPIGTVRSRVARARDELIAHLGDTRQRRAT